MGQTVTSHESLVKFWCSDLRCQIHGRVVPPGGRYLVLHHIVTPSGRLVSVGLSEESAWRKCLEVIADHIYHERSKT